jgi:hypothetical protein
MMRSAAHCLICDLTHATVRGPSWIGAGKLFSRMRAYRLDFDSPVRDFTSGKRRKSPQPKACGKNNPMAPYDSGAGREKRA